MKIEKLLAINVPIKNCNLSCEYCYISALNETEKGKAKFKFSPEHVGKCLSKERLGGVCIINLTGGGETLIPSEMPKYIYELLKQGHYLEVVTNGTLTKRFDEIATFPKEFLKRLEFKFSFHYLELKKKGMLKIYFENIKKMRDNGCSFTVELMPYDKLIPEIPNIITLCKEELGAVCQITVGRNDLKNRELLTDYSIEEYKKIWSIFQSNMFEFKMKIFQRKIKEFCYAGLYSLYIDLGTGVAKSCYGQPNSQNIFEDINRNIKFQPVGKHCNQAYCYNGHAFLTLGMVPEIKAPTYSDIRNRICQDRAEWLQEDLKKAFSQKLITREEEWGNLKKFSYNYLFYINFIKAMIYDRKSLYKKLKKMVFFYYAREK